MCLCCTQAIFFKAGDLLRIEKDKEFPTYALLFNDILVFSTINRDRVLFITEEPISLKFVTDSFFNIRKKGTFLYTIKILNFTDILMFLENEFRLLVETNPLYKDLSPTTRCTPDIIRRSPLREQSKKRTIFLRAHSEDVKKVWQNLITQSVLQLHSSTSTTSFLEPQSHHFNSNQTELTSTKIETDLFFSPSKAHYRNNAFINQLSLKTQNTFDLRESLENLNVDEPESFPETPETPSCANLSHLNEKLHESLSFSSSFRNESCEGIFDFDCDLFTSEVCNESIFCNDDPFFVDE